MCLSSRDCLVPLVFPPSEFRSENASRLGEGEGSYFTPGTKSRGRGGDKRRGERDRALSNSRP